MTIGNEYGYPPRPPSVREALLGGIGAGVLAGTLMLTMLILNSVWQRHVWWMAPNVLASTFYGARALRAGAGFITLSGLALHLLITGSIGGLFGVLCRRMVRAPGLTLLAVFAAISWHFLAYQLFWPRINPLVPLYASQPSAGIAHVLFGLVMGRSLRAFVRAHPPPLPASLPQIEALAVQIPSGQNGPVEQPPASLVEWRPTEDPQTKTAAEGPLRLE